ncbi:hypothetical protein F4808DRAFT_458296 [Astrocystis sublimbata]|nr:hypothetical protein F4808DRAFT_458296 [Astrocystis sublimbata]
MAIQQASRPVVQFLPEPEIIVVESYAKSIQPSTEMAKQVYETFPASELSDRMLDEAAKLFNDHYGVWGPQSVHAGKRVELSTRRLREQYVLVNASTSYTRVTVDGQLAGNAFVCRWEHNDSNVCWVTQLVVHQDYRERGLAGGLLRAIRNDADDVYGIMSSHPAACLAAAACFGMTIEKVSLDFIRQNASTLMKASPIPYVKDAKLCGRLFDVNNIDMVSGVDTDFFVDHEEPLQALDLIQQQWLWPLGNLPDGHEFLLLLQGKRRRSRSHSSSRVGS